MEILVRTHIYIYQHSGFSLFFVCRDVAKMKRVAAFRSNDSL